MPRIPGRQARRVFERTGWVYDRTTGDHMQLVAPGKRTLPVPDYKVIPLYVLRRLIRTAGMTVEEFAAPL